MDKLLTNDDFDLILTSLKYTKRAYQEEDKYPSYEFRQEQLKRVDAVSEKIKALRDQMLKAS